MNNKRGKFLKQLRKEKGYSQIKVGNLLNYTDKNISKWESGKAFPSDPETLKNISSLYEVTVEELLAGERLRIDNEKELSQSLYGQAQIIYRKYNSLKLKLIIVFFLLIITSIFLIYHILIKDITKEYTITFELENEKINVASLLITNSTNVLYFPKISDDNIETIEVYYIDKNKKKSFIKGENESYYIKDKSNKKDYKLKKVLTKNTYLTINYKDGSQINTKAVVRKYYETEIENSEDDNKKMKNINIKNLDFAKLLDYGFINKKNKYIKENNNYEIQFKNNKIQLDNKLTQEIIIKNYNSEEFTHISNEKETVFNETKTINCDEYNCSSYKDYAKYINFLLDKISK